MTPLYNECRSALVAMVLLCLAALAAPAAAQTVVDGSDGKMPIEYRRALLAALYSLVQTPADGPRISHETEISPRAVVDGSDKNVPPGSLAAAVEGAADQGLFDPYGAQFRRLQIAEDRPDYLCGWINAKNRLGAFTGFRPFNYGDGFFNLLPPEDDIYYEMVAQTFTHIGCPIDRR